MKNMIGEIKDIETFTSVTRTELRKQQSVLFSHPADPKKVENLIKNGLLVK